MSFPGVRSCNIWPTLCFPTLLSLRVKRLERAVTTLSNAWFPSWWTRSVNHDAVLLRSSYSGYNEDNRDMLYRDMLYRYVYTAIFTGTYLINRMEVTLYFPRVKIKRHGWHAEHPETQNKLISFKILHSIQISGPLNKNHKIHRKIKSTQPNT